MKRKEYRERWPVTLSVEKDRWKDFEDLCDKEHKSISLKISEMLEKELEKKALGETIPINIIYNQAEQKPLQTDIRQWLPRTDALKMARRIPLDSREWKHLGETFLIIGHKKATGYL